MVKVYRVVYFDPITSRYSLPSMNGIFGISGRFMVYRTSVYEHAIAQQQYLEYNIGSVAYIEIEGV